MKNFLLFFCLLFSFSTFAQQNKFNGTWEGKLNVSVGLRIVFEFDQKTNGTITGILRSPDQTPKPLPIDTTYTTGDSIFATAKKIGVKFMGKLTNDSSIIGVFIQGGQIPLTLKKVATFSVAKRPQTPLAPFLYHAEDVEYFNAEKSLKFGATLTYPAIEPGTNYIKPPVYPVVLLITGSGPQDRDETILLHKPFAVIADYLTRKGFAVLRVDDRGIGKSTGNFAAATTADFANDVEAGLNYLKTLNNIDTLNMGLIGHSEGGMIAPMVASRRKDIKFIVLLAGPGEPIMQLMHEQVEAVALSQGDVATTAKGGADIYVKLATLIATSKDTVGLSAKGIKIMEAEAKKNPALVAAMGLATPQARAAYVHGQITGLNTPWFKYFLNFNPQVYLKKLSCNVLALNGEKDVQVLAAPNLAAITEALKKSKVKKYEVKALPGLNHLFQTCKKCSPTEYGDIEETFSPQALQLMGDWLWQQYIGQ